MRQDSVSETRGGVKHSYIFWTNPEITRVELLWNVMLPGISMCSITVREAPLDCDGTDCYCTEDSVSNDSKPRLIEPWEVPLNPFGGKGIDVNTPLLERVGRFISRLYSPTVNFSWYKHRLNVARSLDLREVLDNKSW